jgi:hypothetical protein
MNLPNYDTWLEAPYRDRDDAQARWEVRADELATVRPQLLEHLADIIDCAVTARIEWPDTLALRRALGAWLDEVRDGELEDRLVVELGILAEWEAP